MDMVGQTAAWLGDERVSHKLTVRILPQRGEALCQGAVPILRGHAPDGLLPGLLPIRRRSEFNQWAEEPAHLAGRGPIIDVLRRGTELRESQHGWQIDLASV